MAWKGDPNNPVPNFTQQSEQVSSEKLTENNRAEQTRRDTDTQKDFTVSLQDIDMAIMKHIETFQLSVTDNGNTIKVPLFYASPEKWKSVQKDSAIRDYNGKLLLPALVFKRINSEKDQAMITFNRYLNYPVMKLYSEKNRYTLFNLLMGRNVPINSVYDVVMPDHMIFTYHFIIWTERVEQMNKLVERLNFETEDYWGDLKGLRFRTRIESFSHMVELQVDQDRMVKTEFDLMVHGYLLPDVLRKLQGNHPTTQKRFTPKKIVLGATVVATDFDLNSIDPNREKWRNQNYPNLSADTFIPSPPITWNADVSLELITKLRANIHVVNGVPTGPPPSSWVGAPTSPSSPGAEGSVAYDTQYLYVYSNGNWKRLPLNLF